MVNSRVCQRSNIQLNTSIEGIIYCGLQTDGCNGGDMIQGLRFLATIGIANSNCYKQNNHSDKDDDCPQYQRDIEDCNRVFCKQGTITQIYGTPAIKTEILTQGPIIAPMKLYKSLKNFTGNGVYTCTDKHDDYNIHYVLLVGIYIYIYIYIT